MADGMMTDKAVIQVGAVRTDGRQFNHGMPVAQECRLQSLTATVASGATNKITFNGAAQAATVLKMNEAMGGSCLPIMLGIIIRFRHTVTLPATAGTFLSMCPKAERLATVAINLTPGKAGSGYLMARSSYVGELESWMAKIPQFTSGRKACDAFCADTQVSSPRFIRNNGGIAAAGRDNQQMIVNRPTLCNDSVQRPVCSPAIITDQQDGTEYSDTFYLPLTFDGTRGIEDAGIGFDDLFSSAQQWYVSVAPTNNVDLYPAGTTFSDWTMEVSVLFRANIGAVLEGEVPRLPEYGNVWAWNNRLGTVVVGVPTFLTGESVENHVYVGYGPQCYDANTDGGKFYWIQLDTGVVASWVKLRIVPPVMDANVLNTDQQYLQVGDGKVYSIPLGADQLSRGNQLLERWNAVFRRQATADGTDAFFEGCELNLFGDIGRRTSPTTLMSFVPNGQVRYGSVPTGGDSIAIQTLEATSMGDPFVQASLGGLLLFPVAFCQPSANNFPGVEIRAKGDSRTIAVTTNNGFTPPRIKPASGTAATLLGTELGNIHVWRKVGSYAEFTGSVCSPCGTQKQAPVVIDPNKEGAPMAMALSASVQNVSATLVQKLDTGIKAATSAFKS